MRAGTAPPIGCYGRHLSSRSQDAPSTSFLEGLEEASACAVEAKTASALAQLPPLPSLPSASSGMLPSSDFVGGLEAVGAAAASLASDPAGAGPGLELPLAEGGQSRS